MNIQICNNNVACSTLMLGHFGINNQDELFEHKFIEAIKMWDENTARSIRMRNMPPNSQMREYFYVCDHAIFVASTSHSQPWAEQGLKRLGFQHTRRVNKFKNNHREIIFWMSPIPEILEKLGLPTKIESPPPVPPTPRFSNSIPTDEFLPQQLLGRPF